MTAFKDFSITNKIRTIVMIVSSITLLMACGILGALEVINFRQTLVHELSILSKIIADRSTASLTFDDPKIAHETLDALKAKHSIISAYIFNDAGEIFASYYRPGSDPDSLPTDLQSEGTGFNTTSLHVISPVLLETEQIGTVFIKSDLKQMYALIWKYIGYVAIVLCLAILTAFFMLAKLQKFISRPILELANAAGLTAVNMDYSTRVTKKGNDEVGLLVDAFNAMMDQIRQRDVKLTESRNRAESSATKARELAKETKQINLKLEKEIAERKRIYNALLNSEKELKDSHKQLEKRVEDRTAELRETNTELRKAIASADAAANAKSEFLGNMSHEIRTPMSGAIGMINLLKTTALNDDQQVFVKGLSTSANRLHMLINDILDFSKIEAGKLTLEERCFSIEDTLQEVSIVLSPLAKQKRISFNYEIDQAVPGNLLGDSYRLSQILLNLAGNAIKFTEQGGVTIRASINNDSQSLRMEIIDTGIGIDEEQLSHIFESFTQADSSTTRRFGGSGLGTTIARELVRMMDGEIGASSALSKGSTFWFEIPLKLAAPKERRTNQLTNPSHKLTSQALHVRDILLAEDSEINALFISTTLMDAGHNVEIVENGQLALERLRNKHYDIVFMDMHMPVMDGIAATRAWRAEEDSKNSIPIIALTANISEDDRLACLQAGMNEFLSKPVSPERIYNILENFTPATASPVKSTD